MIGMTGRYSFALLMLASPLLAATEAVAQSTVPADVELRLGAPAPTIAPLDQAYLTRFVRRHLERRLRGDEPYDPPYVPEVLKGLNCPMAVSLRLHGRLLGAGDSEPLPVLEACRKAADLAYAAASKRQAGADLPLEELIIELEAIGPREAVGRGGDLAGDLARRFEPGIHGIAAEVDSKEIRVRPSQMVSLEVFCETEDELGHNCDRYAIALDNLQDKLGLKRQPPERDPAAVRFLRFRSRHWVEPRPGAVPVELISGLRPLAAGEVTPESLRLAALNLGRYLRHRQTSDGLFSYEFLPGRDVYWPKGQNWVRQTGAVWVLARYAEWSGDAAAGEAAARAIEAVRKWIKPLKGESAASYVATPDNTHPLGATALFCLALMDVPGSEPYLDLRADLLNAMARVQREDGALEPQFAPAMISYGQDFFPGEALLAINRQYAVARDGRWREMADKALPFYRHHFRESRPAMMVPWHLQAWGALARATQLRKYADFVYEMADWVTASQMTAAEHALQIYDGAIDIKGTGRSGIATAVHIEGLADAVKTAEAFGDRERAARYRRVIQRALRFMLQLQFRPEECFYVQSPQEVVGGVRASPYDPSLRIDHSVHALAALLGAIELDPSITTRPIDR